MTIKNWIIGSFWVGFCYLWLRPWPWSSTCYYWPCPRNT